MHHAYYIEGPLSLFESYKEQIKPFSAQQFERFGIDDVRALIEEAGLKNFGGVTFFIATASLPTEAQQALLKLFEEPQPGTTFILLVPYGSVIPTLRSRMLPWPKVLEAEQGNGEAKKFLKSNNKDRSAYIAKLLKDENQVKEQVRELLDGLELELMQTLKKTKGDKVFLDALQDITKVRSYVSDRSPSLKMLLEHLALSIPILK